VAKGENSGSRLRHDFVVRGLFVSKSIDSSGKPSARERFEIPSGAKPETTGIAVFVRDAKTATVLQAITAPLCRAEK